MSTECSNHYNNLMVNIGYTCLVLWPFSFHWYGFSPICMNLVHKIGLCTVSLEICCFFQRSSVLKYTFLNTYWLLFFLIIFWKKTLSYTKLLQDFCKTVNKNHNKSYDKLSRPLNFWVLIPDFWVLICLFNGEV